MGKSVVRLLPDLKNQTADGSSLALLIRQSPSGFIFCCLRREARTPDLSLPFGKDREFFFSLHNSVLLSEQKEKSLRC